MGPFEADFRYVLVCFLLPAELVDLELSSCEENGEVMSSESVLAAPLGSMIGLEIKNMINFENIEPLKSGIRVAPNLAPGK